MSKVKEEPLSAANTLKAFQEGQKQQLHTSNYETACQYAAQQSPMASQMASPPKEPIRPKGDKIGADEIQLVQNHIEKCLQLYMNQNEVITALVSQANIEPGFTSLVWQKLEQQNPEFFRAYHVRLRIKEQITAFNYLASQQFQTLQKSNPSLFSMATTVPGNFFRTDSQSSSSTSSNSSSQGSPPQTNNSSQPAAQKPGQNNKSSPQLSAKKKDDFLGMDTNIFFEQPT